MKTLYFNSQKIVFAALVLAALALGAPVVQAQGAGPAAPGQEDEKTLKDIFEDGDIKKEDNRKKSGSEMAREFYFKCVNSPDYFVSNKTQKNYCACKAAKMEVTMTPKEMAALEDDTKEGNDARNKMRMNADANCLPDAVLRYSYDICQKDPLFREIIVGKTELCKCTRSQVKRQIRRTIPDILIRAATQEPLSTDPLSFFLRSTHFEEAYRMSKTYCYNQHAYSSVKN